jgi:uncharacterized protein (DUF58 family)
MKILSALLGALLLYYLQNYLYRRYWNKGLSVTIQFSEDCAVEGEELELYETVVNRKFLPLPIIKVKFMASRYLTFLDSNNSSVTDNYYRNELISIMMYQKLTRTLRFLCSHRGYYAIHNIDIICSDIFVSFEAVNNYPVDTHLYVYPKLIDSDQFHITFRNMLGTVLTKRFINEDPFEFRSIREYQSYDTLKSVNWKASAKTGTLKVNVNDYTAQQQVKIFLNLESETILTYDDLQEESIRIAASFAFGFINQGIPTAIYTNARDVISKNILSIPAGSGDNHLRNLNEILARIDTKQSISAFVPTIHNSFKQSTEHDFIIIISTYQKDDLQDLLTYNLNTKTEFSWIIPINQDIKISIKEELLNHIIPWEMK